MLREVSRTGAGLSGLSEWPGASLSWAQGNALGLKVPVKSVRNKGEIPKESTL